MERILFNCTTNIVGGGVKNSAFFIKYAINSNSFEWYFAISPEVNRVLKKWNINSKNILEISPYPSRSKSSKQKLLNFLNQSNVTLVYTMAGPAYIRFPVKHIMGISNGYITHNDWHAIFFKNSIKGVVNRTLLSLYQIYNARKANHWFFQTQIARDGFCKRTKVSKIFTSIIPNAFDQEFLNTFLFDDYKRDNGQIIIFSPSADHRHRGLQTIPDIAAELLKINRNLKFKFTLTLPEKSQLWKSIYKHAIRLNVADVVINEGPYTYSESSQKFQNCSLVFIPSILETFSSNYLEAMATGKPLIANDKPFARDICKTAALYVKPENSKQTALSIYNLIKNNKQMLHLIQEGEKTLKQFPTQEERFKLIEETILSTL